MTRTQRCKKCRAEKGKPHKSSCVVARYPSSYTDSTVYTWASDTSSSYGSSTSCDTSSSSSSDSSGGGGCE